MPSSSSSGSSASARRHSLTKTDPSPAPAPSLSSASTLHEDNAAAAAGACAIKVVVRVRPLNEREILAHSPVVVNVTRSSVQVINPILFSDPSFLDAISTPTRRATVGDVPMSLSSAALTAATAAGESRTFHFDRCFGVDNAAVNEGEPFAHAYDIDFLSQRPNQELVFEEVGQDIIPSALQGFNCTVLAYGQTGSGKTHTMVGEKTTKGKGIIPRVCEALFAGIDARRAKENDLAESVEAATVTALAEGKPLPSTTLKKTVYTVQMSYCEIYKEKVYDLLDATSTVSLTPTGSFSTSAASLLSGPESPSHHSQAPTRGKVLRVREHPVTGPFVADLSSRLVASYDEIAEEMIAGDKLRTVAATRMNPVSSRSHAVFTLTITQTAIDGATQIPSVKTSKICLIDLAGSERANVSGTSGDRLKEGAMINKSLTTLGRVIAALSTRSTNERVPYRDSTLTWLLKESLGGNAKTTMLAMVSPAADSYDETMSTLRYAESAKKVLNRAVINEDPNARIIRLLRDEVQQLKSQLAQREREAFYLAENLRDDTALPADAQDRESFYRELQAEQQASRRELEELQRRLQEDAARRKTSARVARLHPQFPSLVNVTNASEWQADVPIVFCLGDVGVSVVGRREDPVPVTELPSPARRPAEPAGSPRRLSRTPSWAGGLLRRRKSSTTEDCAGAASPRKAKLSKRASGSLDAVEEITSVLALPAASHGGGDDDDDGVLPRHAVITVGRRQPSPSADGEATDGKNETEDDDYMVYVQPVDATSAVSLNGHAIPSDALTRVAHGDELAFGRLNRHRFRLHIPQIAVKKAMLTRLEAATNSTEDTPATDATRCAEWVDEANALSIQWRLGFQFSLQAADATHSRVSTRSALPEQASQHSEATEPTNQSRDAEAAQHAPAESDGAVVEDEKAPEAVVCVTRRVADDSDRYLMLRWRPSQLEQALVVLRQLAAALDMSGAVEQQDERDDKLSAARDPLPIEDEEDASDDDDEHESRRSTTTHTRAVPASMSMDAFNSTTAETLGPSGGLHTSSSPGPAAALASGGGAAMDDVELAPPAVSVRLLGHARVHLGGLSGAGPEALRRGDLQLPLAVYDAAGRHVGHVHCRLEPGPDSPSTRRRRLSTALKTEGGKAPAALRVAVVLDRVELLAAAPLFDQVSLTLRRWRRSVSLGTGASTGATATPSNNASSAAVSAEDSMGGNAAPQPGESTPKVSMLSTARGVYPLNSYAFHTTALTLDDSEDGVAIEVWGYNEDAPGRSERLELFVSVDVDERDGDGMFRPAAVKTDGSLRLHVNQPRRLNVRVTQADHAPFVLQDIALVQLGPRVSTGSAANLSVSDGKATQWLLVGLPSTAGTDASASSSRAIATSELEELPIFQPWQHLHPRAECEVDAAGRSLQVSLRWEPHAETADTDDARSVLRVALAVTTSLSTEPIVVSKCVVTKLSALTVTSAQRLAREWESSRTAWWARDPFSRAYRLGTWYSVECLASLASSTAPAMPVDVAPEMEVTTDGSEMTEKLVPRAAASALRRHIIGLRRLELALAMERLRQQVMVRYLATRISDEYPLTLELAQECLNVAVFGEQVRDGDPPQSTVIRVLQVDAGLFALRHKSNKELFIALESGDTLDLHEAPTEMAESADHTVYFVSEPTQLASVRAEDRVGDMCGYLLFSTAVQLDETAVIAPLPAAATPSGAFLSRARQTLTSKLSWERRWLVLKRPFLYAYKSFARKEQVGVLDISRSQLVVHSNNSGSSGGTSPSGAPLSFQLLSLVGSKCVVWSLQASTPSELRAWLVALDPLKIEARQAVLPSDSDGRAIEPADDAVALTA
ncbi:hypothetical protein ATCC90586_008332 [Pythium insidiosum]|nr:hypothetical protein ATCC90586_008332 [Pythium insidiosum]